MVAVFWGRRQVVIFKMAQTGTEEHRCVVTRERRVQVRGGGGDVGEEEGRKRQRVKKDEREREGGREYTIAAHKANSCVGNVL